MKKKFVGKEEKINGKWYPVVVHAESVQEANKMLYKVQKSNNS